MTEIERKALALVNEVSDGFHDVTSIYEIHTAKTLRSALCRAIEQHETFRQEVSDAVSRCRTSIGLNTELDCFIINKPDPLVEAVADWINNRDFGEGAASLRAAIEKRGGKIVWGEG